MSRLRKTKREMFTKGITMNEPKQAPPMIQIVVRPDGSPVVQSNCLDPLVTSMLLAQAGVVWAQHLAILRQRQSSIVLPDGSPPPLPRPMPEEEFVPVNGDQP